MANASRRPSDASQDQRRSVSTGSGRTSIPGLQILHNAFDDAESNGLEPWDFNSSLADMNEIPGLFPVEPLDENAGVEAFDNDFDFDQYWASLQAGLSSSQPRRISQGSRASIASRNATNEPVFEQRNSLVSLPSQSAASRPDFSYPDPQQLVPGPYYSNDLSSDWDYTQPAGQVAPLESWQTPMASQPPQAYVDQYQAQQQVYADPQQQRQAVLREQRLLSLQRQLAELQQQQVAQESQRPLIYAPDHFDQDQVGTGFLGQQENSEYPEPAFRKRAGLRSKSGSSHASHSSHASSQPARSTSSSYSDGSGRVNRTARRRLHEQRKSLAPHRPSTIQVHLPGQKPKMDDDRPWIRTNNTTQGLTTRTSKINDWRSPYDKTREPPLGHEWVHPKGQVFRTNQHGELSEKTYSAKEIENYILDYPEDLSRGIRLILWIQKNSTDSARRYASPSHSKCLFKECPAHVYQNTGTIIHGHFRVAMDEMYYAHGDNADPFMCAGFVHLYCMERFIDFARICRRCTVKVDTRDMVKEPKGKFACTLANSVEADPAGRFVDAASQKRKDLSTGKYVLWEDHPDNIFKDYPVRKELRNGHPWPYKSTLCYKMTHLKNQHRPAAQKRQFEARGAKNSNILFNNGDLELHFAKEDKSTKQSKKGKQKRKHDEDSSDDEDNEVIEQRPAKRGRHGSSSRGSAKSTKRTRQTRQTYDLTEDGDEVIPEFDGRDDDSEDELQVLSSMPAPSSRSSKRLSSKKRPNYNVDDEIDNNSVRRKKARRGGSAANSHEQANAPYIQQPQQQQMYQQQQQQQQHMRTPLPPQRPHEVPAPYTEHPQHNFTGYTPAAPYQPYPGPQSTLLHRSPGIEDPSSSSSVPQTASPGDSAIDPHLTSPPTGRLPSLPSLPDLEDKSKHLREEDLFAALSPSFQEMSSADLDAILAYDLQRRKSSLTAGVARRASRGLSLLKSGTSRRGEGKRVSIGGATTKVFDSEEVLRPGLGSRARRSSARVAKRGAR